MCKVKIIACAVYCIQYPYITLYNEDPFMRTHKLGRCGGVTQVQVIRRFVC